MKDTESFGFIDLARSEQLDGFIRSFWELTHVPIAIMDPDFKESKYFCSENKMNAICRVIRSTAEGRAACMRTDILRCNQAATEKQGIRYFCHAGLVDFARPIFVLGRHIGTIMCGQILSEAHSESGFEKFYEGVKRFKLDKEELRCAYFKTPYMTKAQLEALLRLLTFFSEYVCELGVRLSYSKNNLRHPEIEHAKNYLKKNFRESLSLDQVAEEVGLSSAYLSRIFKKEENKTFTAYVQYLRLDEARKLLIDSDMKIIDIAMSCGFENVCYFNELFKKTQGCTPRNYRKNHNF